MIEPITSEIDLSLGECAALHASGRVADHAQRLAPEPLPRLAPSAAHEDFARYDPPIDPPIGPPRFCADPNAAALELLRRTADRHRSVSERLRAELHKLLRWLDLIDETSSERDMVMTHSVLAIRELVKQVLEEHPL